MSKENFKFIYDVAFRKVCIFLIICVINHQFLDACIFLLHNNLLNVFNYVK